MLIIWLCIEVRMFSFILLLIISRLLKPSTHPVKYFLFQAMASIIFLLSSIMLLQHQIIIVLILLIKLGAAPFHLWLIAMVNKITFLSLIWVRVIQKIIPLRLILFLSWSTRTIFFSLLRYILGVLHIIFQTKLIKMVVASSIYITPWVIIAFLLQESLGWIVFFIYRRLQIVLISLIIKILFLSLKNRRLRRTLNDTFVLITILFLRGFPPRPLFFLKLKIVILILRSLRFIVSILFLVGSRVVIYNYLNMIVRMFTLRSSKFY